MNYNPMKTQIATKQLENAVTHAIKKYIRDTGSFPEIHIAKTKDLKSFGVKVLGGKLIVQ